jgi:hypothetical protein
MEYEGKPMPEFTTILLIGGLVGFIALMSIALLPATAGDKAGFDLVVSGA